MAQLDTFIETARAKGLSDAAIEKALTSEGWDKHEVQLAISGVSVPKPPQSTAKSVKMVSLHPAVAALHHVLLWFFVGSSSISIAAVITSLTGGGVNVTALAALLAVTGITFTPYAVFFITYLVQLKKQPGLIPGHVWSIITICLHSLGALGAGIILAVTAITNPSDSNLISSAIILALYSIVIVTYSIAAFSKGSTIKRVILSITLSIITGIIGTLAALSIVQIVPAQQDEALRRELVTTTKNIVAFTKQEQRLPTESEASTLISHASIRYAATSDTTYELCAPFLKPRLPAQSYTSPAYAQTDSFQDESLFYSDKVGDVCFSLESGELAYQKVLKESSTEQ